MHFVPCPVRNAVEAGVELPQGNQMNRSPQPTEGSSAQLNPLPAMAYTRLCVRVFNVIPLNLNYPKL
jgi:hypothetical protein